MKFAIISPTSAGRFLSWVCAFVLAQPLWVSAQCPTFRPPRALGTVQDPALVEISGIAASRKNDRVLWAHNDSGDSPRVFALAYDGRRLAEFGLAGASAVDWEDMAIGPGPEPGRDYLYLGDIGANIAARPNIVVYRIAEPVVDSRITTGSAIVSDVEAMTLTFDDSVSRDTEALMIDPVAGDLFVITKQFAQGARVYRKPAPHAAGAGVLQFVGTTGSDPLVTAAEISPDGAEILVRTYSSVKLWKRGTGQSVAQALGGSPCALPAASEPQGEAICFAPGACGYFTISEGSARPIYFYERPGRCAAWDAVWAGLE